METSEGARRLSLVLGWIGASLAAFFGIVLIEWTATGLAVFLLLCAVGFLIPWGVVQILAWVVEGFFLDRSGPDYQKGREAWLKGRHRVALRHLRPLAEQGHALAQVTLGQMYDNGNGVKRDPLEAVRWLQKAAEKGQAWGQVLLADMYAMGRGVAHPDEDEAIRWKGKAAQQGHTAAQFDMGCHYAKPCEEFARHVQGKSLQGKRVGGPMPVDLRLQLMSLQKESNQDYEGPKFILLDEWETESSEQTVDYVEAYKWFSLAAAKRGAEAMRVTNLETDSDLMVDLAAKQAAQMRDALQSVMTTEQIKRAERLVSEWRPEHERAASVGS